MISFIGAAIPLHQARRALRSVFAKRSESVFGMVEGNASTSPFFVGIRPIFMIKYSGMEDYSGKKILILGLAREGIDSLRYFLEKYPTVQIAAADRAEAGKLSLAAAELLARNPQVRFFGGISYLETLDCYDLIVKSPGIPIHLPSVEAAFEKGKITSQTEIFFKECPGTIIGVTGTKGKSTTASIIYEIIKRSGKKTFLLGNIGEPMLSYLSRADKDTFFVCELSAHQLYNLKRSPHIAVVTNIYPEHLDYYKNYNEYILAKMNICLHQTKNDHFIYNGQIKEIIPWLKKTKAQKIDFSAIDWRFEGETALTGEFNMENAKIGAIVGRLLGVADNVIDAAIADFKPLPNRLEFVGNFGGIDCYNDSLSTIQESAVAAIEALGPRVQTLIAGGFDRNQPFDKLARAVLNSEIRNLVMLPTTGIKIWREIEKQAELSGKVGRFRELECCPAANMREAVDLVFAKTEKGKICLLSAAAASFGGFADYADRGRQFRECLIAGGRSFAAKDGPKNKK